MISGPEDLPQSSRSRLHDAGRTSEKESGPHPSGGSRAAAEIVFVVICVLLAEWAVIPVFGRSKAIGMIPVVVVFVFGFLSHRSRHESAPEIGFGAESFPGAMRVLLLWMVPASGILVTIGWLLGTLHFGAPRNWSLFAIGQCWLFLWAMMQQYALQAIINRRAQEIWGKGRISVLAVALVFGVLHLPNLWLSLATLAGGILWAAVYQRYPNLYALALSHGLMTSVLAASISPAALHGLRVGYNYY
jgi:hypothetical protein